MANTNNNAVEQKFKIAFAPQKQFIGSEILHFIKHHFPLLDTNKEAQQLLQNNLRPASVAQPPLFASHLKYKFAKRKVSKVVAFTFFLGRYYWCWPVWRQSGQIVGHAVRRGIGIDTCGCQVLFFITIDVTHLLGRFCQCATMQKGTQECMLNKI